MASASLVYHSQIKDQIEAMHKIGYAYIPKVLTDKQVTELKYQMDQLSGITESFDRDCDGQSSDFLEKHINNAFNRDRSFFDCLDVEGVIEIAEGVHGNDCHVIGMTAWVTGPGRPDQVLSLYRPDGLEVTRILRRPGQPGLQVGDRIVTGTPRLLKAWIHSTHLVTPRPFHRLRITVRPTPWVG